MKPRQGHTRWKAVVYAPGKIEGHDDDYCACVFPCRVTELKENTVFYRSGYGEGMPYLCHTNFWKTKTYPTYRKAFRAAMAELDECLRSVSEESK